MTVLLALIQNPRFYFITLLTEGFFFIFIGAHFAI